MPILTTQLHYNSKSKLFSAEISELENVFINDKYHTILNPKTGISVVFNLVKVDKDYEGEVCGWRFKSKCGLGLLIIND